MRVLHFSADNQNVNSTDISVSVTPIKTATSPSVGEDMRKHGISWMVGV